MVNDRNTAVIYTTAVCNLKCTYCYIDKNPALKTIDDILDESFKGNYYIDFIKKMFPNGNQLTTLETWGGEPFIRMDRCYNLIQDIIDNYSSFSNFFSSTNMTLKEEWIKQFEGLISVFRNNSERQFNVNIQMSIDGPEYINDRNRGIGVTKKIEETFDLFIEYLRMGNIPNNVNLTIHPKPTFDMQCIKDLNSKEKIIEYYDYIESFIKKIKDLNLFNVDMVPNIPNTASPYPHTKEDGEIFANLCKITRELEKENRFSYFDDITLYSKGYCCPEGLSYKCTNFTCGTGYTTLGFLPYDKISTCHNGFVDLISDYKKMAINNKDSVLDFKFFMDNTKSRFCLSQEEYAEFERQMTFYNTPDTTARMSNMCINIISLAIAGQIDKKYIDQVEALKAAQFIRNKTSFCVRDNYSITGSINLQPLGIYKLLLNGAKDIIEGDNN